MKFNLILALCLLTTSLTAHEGEGRKSLFSSPKPTILPADFYHLPPPPPPVEEKPIIPEIKVKHDDEAPEVKKEEVPEPPKETLKHDDEEQAVAAQSARQRLARQRLAQRRANQEPFKVKEEPTEPEKLYDKDLNYRVWDQRLGEDKFTYPVDRDWVLTEDRIITGRLDREVSSAVGGRVNIVVNRPIFAAKGRKVIFPQYTKLICEYQPLQKVSDTKLSLKCRRAIRPDGASLLLSDNMAMDEMGRSSLVGDVDFKTLEKYGSAFTMSLIATLADASSARLSNKNPTLQNGTSQLSQNLGQVTAEVIEQYIDLAPVVTIEAGTLVHIQPTSDIWLRQPISRQELEAIKKIESQSQQQRQAAQQQNQSFPTQQQGG